MNNFQKPIRVTISDAETGAELESRVVENDYVIITVGNRYVKSVQVMGRTHMLAVAVEKRPPPLHLGEMAGELNNKGSLTNV